MHAHAHARAHASTQAHLLCLPLHDDIYLAGEALGVDNDRACMLRGATRRACKCYKWASLEHLSRLLLTASVQRTDRVMHVDHHLLPTCTEQWQALTPLFLAFSWCKHKACAGAGQGSRRHRLQRAQEWGMGRGVVRLTSRENLVCAEGGDALEHG